MSTTRRFHALVCAAIALTLAAADASAQDPALDDIRRELAVLRTEVQQLRAELQALKAVPRPEGLDAACADAAAPASLELLQTQVAELAQVKVESTSRMPVKVFGTIHTSAFLNSRDPNWLDLPNLVNAPPADGASGTFGASLRQTRLGFTVDGPTLNTVRTSGAVALDFFGGIPGFQTGQVMGLPRLLVAYARLETDRTALQVGQEHMILAPLDPTSLASFSFPALFRSGNLYLRTPHVRVEREIVPRLRVTGGIVAPIGGDVVGEDYRFVPPALGGERSRRPGLQARIALTTAALDEPRHVNVGVSGHYGWERRPGGRVESSAAALDFAVRRDVIGAAGEVFVGQNVDAFGGALGLDARARGGWAEVQVHPTRRLSFAAGGGLDEVLGPRRFVLPRRRNQSAFGTALFSLTPEIQASFEYHWLATQPAAGSERRNHHVDWALAYRF